MVACERFPFVEALNLSSVAQHIFILLRNSEILRRYVVVQLRNSDILRRNVTIAKLDNNISTQNLTIAKQDENMLSLTTQIKSLNEVKSFTSDHIASPIISTVVGELLLFVIGEQPKHQRKNSSWYTKRK